MLRDSFLKIRFMKEVEAFSLLDVCLAVELAYPLKLRKKTLKDRLKEARTRGIAFMATI